MMRNLLLSSVLLLMLFGCSKIVNNALDNIHYEVVDIDIKLDKDLGSVLDSFMQADFNNAPQVNITTRLNITNNNAVSIVIDDINYKAYLLDVHLVDGTVDHSISIQANSSQLLPIPLVISMADLSKNNIGLKEIQDLDLFVIKGTSRIKSSVGDMVISFDITNGKFNITNIKY